MTLLKRELLAATVGALSELRHEVHAWALAVGFDEATSEDVTLAVYEAMTNAVEHAYPPGRAGPLQLIAAVSGTSTAEVVITDQGVWRDPPHDPGRRGRGLQLIGLLAGHAAIRAGTHGTTVTLRWPLPQRAAAGPSNGYR